MVQGLFATVRGFNGDTQVITYLPLADKLGKGAGPQAAVKLSFLGIRCCVEDHRLGHRTCTSAAIHHATCVSEELPIFDLLGADKIHAIVAGFYRRVPEDDILGPMYPKDDIVGAEARLRDFLIYRFGGPADYIRDRGHPRLRMRHITFPVDQAARDRWMALMMAAIDEQDLTAEHRAYLEDFLGGVATFLMNR